MKILATSLVDQMTIIAKKAQENNVLTSYLTDIDKDVMLFDSQAGINFLWILKNSGAGTWLCQANQEIKKLYLNDEPDDSSEIYLITATGINQGHITKIDKKDALSYRYNEPLGIIARRKFSSEVLSTIFCGINIKETLLYNEWRTNPGEIVLLKIWYETSNKTIFVDLYRKKICPFSYEDRINIQNKKRYHMPISIEMINFLDKQREAKFFEIENTQQFYAKQKQISFESYMNNINQTILV
ncbi:hypothetical protein UA38_11920 [Photobacterium kishitanii]|uniref:Uncharacterized protein n=1 Tax=Photobacterium kishitanii TaxID=318456 RepID=A0AAX0YWI5_9GAMM|nr:hypothetical protein [Photobacterium kishitanii]KJG57075.1 hypothetical protein UA38_11920 [Photobacterium kishitanii]KJG68540.1 hypothetical protein UA41_16825 [Photobacterium kishitanii]PSX18306.1 hypothetical protein C0W70_15675 [Photobacterium kishitanii]PSX26807.1 hypothetical protein C0W52_16610 [Photobacterium kishitanii]PSX31093.1 hypothetical protein C0W39_18055 [Photobacterium kishitanii]